MNIFLNSVIDKQTELCSKYGNNKAEFWNF